MKNQENKETLKYFDRLLKLHSVRIQRYVECKQKYFAPEMGRVVV